MENDDLSNSQSAATPANPPAAPTLTSDEKNFGLFAHLLGLAGFVFPFGNIVGPLVIYLLQKDKSAYARAHAVESLNFQISVTIYTVISFVLSFVLIGIPLMIAIAITDVICIILASIKASEGTLYRYPLTIRMVS